jgi:hypothetical protein
MSTKIAVWVERATHKALSRHAKAKGIGVGDAADALIKTGLARSAALAKARTKKAPPKAVVEEAVAEPAAT